MQKSPDLYPTAKGAKSRTRWLNAISYHRRTTLPVHDRALLALLERFGPVSPPMDDADHFNAPSPNSIRDDKGERVDHELAGALPSAAPSDARMITESGRRLTQGRCDASGRFGIMTCDVFNDLHDVSDGCVEPVHIHAIRSG